MIGYWTYREMARQTALNSSANDANAKANQENATASKAIQQSAAGSLEVARDNLLLSRNHYQLETAVAFSQRLDSDQMVRARHVVDNFVASHLSVKQLLDDAMDPEANLADMALSDQQKLRRAHAQKSDEIAREFRIFANFFQQLGTALKHDTVPVDYAWDVFGALAQRYRKDLKGYIEEMRIRRERPTLYQEFDLFVNRMAKMDEAKAKEKAEKAEAEKREAEQKEAEKKEAEKKKTERAKAGKTK